MELTISANSANALIRTSGIAASEATTLLAAASGLTRERLITQDGFDAGVVERYRSLCARRAKGEPIAYLIGEREFYGRVFLVTHEVLIPRPETELLVDRALQKTFDRARVLDLGTGSGTVAVSFACENPTLRVVATDISPGALDVARQNARRLGAHIDFVESDWFSAFGAAGGCAADCTEPGAGHRFDVIVSNPPYIAAGDRHLVQGDLRFEPRLAQIGGADGLSEIRAIVRGCSAHLGSGGWLLLEHGYDQADAVRALLAEAGFTEIECSRDLAGIGRVSAGRR